MDIGANLDRIMKLAGIMTQSQLARESGIHQSTINRILQNKGSTYIDTLKALASACGVTVSELLNESAETSSILLTYVTQREATLLTNFRECSEEGKLIVIAAAETARELDK